MDELYSGVPAIGSPEIQATFGATYAATASMLLLVPGVVAGLVEPILFVFADRYPRRWFVCGGLVAMAVGAALAAVAPAAWVLCLALCLAFIGSGAGVALAQATVVDARPHARAEALASWALFGEIGDLVGPLLMAGVAALGASWRVAYLLVGGLALACAVLVGRERFPALERTPEGGARQGAHDDTRPEAEVGSIPEDDDDEEPGVLEALRVALRQPGLVVWLGAAAACDLLDEIVVVFAALFLRDTLQLGAVARSAILGSGVIGALLGTLVLPRLLRRFRPLPLLLGACLVCALSYVGWLASSSPLASALWFFGVGVAAAPMYPVASAKAYEALPGRSGTVNAVAHVFTPLSLAAPAALGLVADALGIRTALALLLLQPGLVAFVAARARRAPRRRASPAPEGTQKVIRGGKG